MLSRKRAAEVWSSWRRVGPRFSASPDVVRGLQLVGGWVEPGPELFFLVPAPTQLSAYANHEFKIISTPAQLSAYANHELKN